MGRAYSGSALPRYNVVVVRDDATDVGDAALGRAPWTEHGEVSCTHTFDFGLGDGEQLSDRTLLCLRAGDTLTVSVLVLGGADGTGDVDVAVRGVNEVWELQQ
jgi:hypothetical protein